MAMTITRYRQNNPGQNYRSFNITAVNGDGPESFLHNCLWTPDSWSIVSIDGTNCAYVGQYRGALSSTVTPNDTFTVFKEVPVGSGGSLRLTLEHLNTRP